MNPQKLLEKIGRGETANIRFSDLTGLVDALGFELTEPEAATASTGIPERSRSSTCSRFGVETPRPTRCASF